MILAHSWFQFHTWWHFGAFKAPGPLLWGFLSLLTLSKLSFLWSALHRCIEHWRLYISCMSYLKGKHPRQPDASHSVLSSTGFIIITAVGTVTADDSQSRLYLKCPFRSEFTLWNPLDSIKFQNKKRSEHSHWVLRGSLSQWHSGRL